MLNDTLEETLDAEQLASIEVPDPTDQVGIADFIRTLENMEDGRAK